MPNYANGKIYQIISPNHPVPYIGSTTQPLSKRMTAHRTPANKTTSRIIIDAEDAYIELIEEFPCENREQLNKREGEIIRSRECVNRNVAGRTHKDSDKAYYEANREAMKDRSKAYYEANREAMKDRHKAYREANREAKSASNKAYYAKKKAEASSECPILSPSSGSVVLS